jgi:hypothetical protein
MNVLFKLVFVGLFAFISNSMLKMYIVSMLFYVVPYVKLHTEFVFNLC